MVDHTMEEVRITVEVLIIMVALLIMVAPRIMVVVLITDWILCLTTIFKCLIRFSIRQLVIFNLKLFFE